MNFTEVYRNAVSMLAGSTETATDFEEDFSGAKLASKMRDNANRLSFIKVAVPINKQTKGCIANRLPGRLGEKMKVKRPALQKPIEKLRMKL
jgi:hypothetical protein